MCMAKIATDTYSFSDIRNGSFVYVDKTVTLAGVAFDSEMRNLSDRKIAVCPQVYRPVG